MQLFSLLQAEPTQNAATCTVLEYPHHDPSIDGAHIRIQGRYPETGWVRNTRSKELVYILKGSGKIILENEQQPLSPGDMLLIQPNEWFAWQGECELLVLCTPAFDVGQYEQKA